MTVKTKNDLDRVQLYIQKLQEIKGFLQQTRWEADTEREVNLKINCYWN